MFITIVGVMVQISRILTYVTRYCVAVRQNRLAHQQAGAFISRIDLIRLGGLHLNHMAQLLINQ